MAHFANRDRTSRNDLNYTMVCPLLPYTIPTTEGLDLCRYRGLSGTRKMEESTGKI